MSRLKEKWHVGQPVWTRFRNVEWRSAVITRLGYKLIDVFFNTGKKSYGKRLAENLRPRDPALKGKDKPESLKKEEGEEALLADANREMFGDDVAELMDLGILPDDIGAK